ncbi:hypothetical protein [Catenulispora rubra]|uniref:hypothetical protein n=1 Tax=Catenulispora rubra TaxID=280293 RepID=UPI0018927527|nr:hypothetical protein [Catenulispora rubra]
MNRSESEPPASAGAATIGEGKNPDKALRRLAARVDWLEERLRASGGVPVADLEPAVEHWEDLADAVQAGRDAEESLLDARVRDQLTADVEEFAVLEADRDRAAQAVLSISTELQSSGRGDLRHQHNAQLFTAAEQRLAEASALAAGRARAAQSARARLAEDAERGASQGPVIDAGREALQELDSLLHEVLEVEVKRGAVMPAWFCAEFGHAPGRADSAEWLDAAVGVLSYRLVYEVDDQRIALGAEPAAGPLRHAFDEYWRLRSLVNRLD